MTDSELLELAAKAASIDIDQKTFGEYQDAHRGMVVADGEHWNPIVDDGDALRLAVKLGLVVDVGPVSVSVHKNNGNRDLGFEFYNTGKDDPYAATRRAIVRAAAEIGKGMK